jgi:putative ABC transport system substrate-binding protein
MIRRRSFLTLLGGAAAWPFAARAQGGMRRIGVLMAISENEEGRARVAAFREGLRAFGRVEERDQVEVRWGAGDVAKVQALANELVQLKPDVILAIGTTVTRALRAHTSDIPVVFVLVSDPIGDQLVASLAKPGGNITGFTTFEFSLASKWLEILKESAPSVRRVALVFNPMKRGRDRARPRSVRTRAECRADRSAGCFHICPRRLDCCLRCSQRTASSLFA